MPNTDYPHKAQPIRIAIIGAGAAGCFCAVELKRLRPDYQVTVLERGQRALTKVAITGGGRCNLTNSFRQVRDLAEVYPRGWRLMGRLLRRFSNEDCMRWWQEHGVSLVTQEDECVFPKSQDAMEIVGTLLREMHHQNVELIAQSRVERVTCSDAGCKVSLEGKTLDFDYVVVTTGGAPRLSGLNFLSPLNLQIEPPTPSLFALNTGDERLHGLSGTVVESAVITLAGTNYRAEGALLITHFGMSGPAILRLSSYATRYLSEKDYRCPMLVNWMEGRDEGEVAEIIDKFRQTQKLIGNHHPKWVTGRLWAMLIERASVSASQRWDVLNKKERNRLIATLTADTYPIEGRRTYKGEFVTAGGISLKEIDGQTLSLHRYPRIYVAGEVTDVDGVTGGFNLQAAWTMGWVVAQSLSHLNISQK